MENVGTPAIIAYQNGNVIATLPDCSAVGLETTLRRSACPLADLPNLLLT
jgi:hypothetical protein